MADKDEVMEEVPKPQEEDAEMPALEEVEAVPKPQDQKAAK
jgi:hypothetical protein